MQVDFHRGDKVRKVGTIDPIYEIMGKTGKINKPVFEDYTISDEDYYTCIDKNSNEHPINLKSSELELIGPMSS